MTYVIDLTASTQSARLTLGARVGYDASAKTFSIDDVLGFTNNAHATIDERQRLSAVIMQGVLCGRSSTSCYTEPIFYVDLLRSPRVKPLSQQDFETTVLSYATSLGEQMQQERVYAQIGDKTTILRRAQ